MSLVTITDKMSLKFSASSWNLAATCGGGVTGSLSHKLHQAGAECDHHRIIRIDSMAELLFPLWMTMCGYRLSAVLLSVLKIER